MFRFVASKTHSIVQGCRIQQRQLVRFNATSALERYKAKLEKKAKELGVDSVEKLQETLEEEIKEKKAMMNKVDPLKELEEYERRQAEELAKDKSKSLNKNTVRGPIDKNAKKLPYKTLESFVDVEKIRILPQKDIEYLWKARFLSKERTLSASLSDIQFASIYASAFKNPSFILPLPKEGQDGYEMHFVQWNFVGPHTAHCMLTTVAEYKLHKEYAKPHTTLMFHQELSQSHGLVLMNGQVEADVPLTLDEAQLLVLNVQRFYGGVGTPESVKRKRDLLHAFTNGDQSFNLDSLIAEASSTD